MAEARALPERHVLIVEDEAVIALDLAEMFGHLGWRSSIASRSHIALDMLESDSFDAASLDVNLAGTVSTPIADELARRGIPFIIATGYEMLEVPPAHRDVPIVAKPFSPRDIEQALQRAFARQIQSTPRRSA